MASSFKSMVLLATALVAATACQTVQDQSIVLKPDFVQKSQLYVVKRPTWRLTDEAYQQQIGAFTIAGADTSWQTSTSSNLMIGESGLVNEAEVKDSWMHFILDDLFFDKNVQRFKTTGEQDFAFNVMYAGQPLARSQCRLMFLNDVTKVTYNNDPDNTKGSSEKRKRSYLGCKLLQGEQSWQLIIDANPNGQLRMSMSDANTHLQIQPVTEALNLVDNQWLPAPSWISLTAGLTIADDTMQLAALSFEGQQPKVWLSQGMNASQQALMMAASYSVFMYDWLDEKWRQPGFNFQ